MGTVGGGRTRMTKYRPLGLASKNTIKYQEHCIFWFAAVDPCIVFFENLSSKNTSLSSLGGECEVLKKGVQDHAYLGGKNAFRKKIMDLSAQILHRIDTSHSACRVCRPHLVLFLFFVFFFVFRFPIFALRT